MLSIQVLWFCTKQEQEYLKSVVIIDQLELITINRNCVLNLRKLVLKVSSGGSLTVDQHQCKLPSKSKKISAMNK